MSSPPDSTNERLAFSERWLRDGLAVLQPSLSVLQIRVDMTSAHERLERLRSRGVPATTTHLVVHATARALDRNRALHQVVAGVRRERPARVDIALSVTGDAFVSPVVVIEGAESKSVAEIVADVARLTPLAREADRKLRQALDTWGRLLPFGFLRRGLLRLLNRRPAFRRKAGGTFQISTIPAEWGVTGTFSPAGVLIAGQVWSQVVAVDDQPAVRPTMTLTLCSDHGVWDGRAATRLLSAVREQLELREEPAEAAVP